MYARVRKKAQKGAASIENKMQLIIADLFKVCLQVMCFQNKLNNNSSSCVPHAG